MYNMHFLLYWRAALPWSRVARLGGKQGGRGYIATHVWIPTEHRVGARGIEPR